MTPITLDLAMNSDGSVTISLAESDQTTVVELIAKMQRRSNDYGAVVDALQAIVDAWEVEGGPDWKMVFEAVERARGVLKGVEG